MTSGNKRTGRTQRITVYVIVGAVVLSLALSLLTGAGALGSPARTTAPALVTAPEPIPTDTPLIGSTGDPLPVTKTPQGTATQVTSKEHLGGLIAYLAFMLGGVLLLVRSHRRHGRKRRSEPILS